MVHTNSSTHSPLGDDSVSSNEKQGTSATKNGRYIDPLVLRKSKRFKNAAESEFPPDCGLSSLQLRSRTIQKKFQVETCENKNVSDDCVPSSEAEVEFISGEDVGKQDRLKPVDEKLCNDMDLGVTEVAESHRVNMHEPMQDRNLPLPENTRELNSEMVTLNNERFAPNSSSGDSARSQVKETLRYFHAICRKILQEEEARPKKRDGRKFRVDWEASKILKSQGLYLNSGTHIMGTVPGVEVGDEFKYRMELKILGIHRQVQVGIDYMKDDSEELVAMSIISYDDDLDYSDVLIYTGQGGNVGTGKKITGDQKLVKGNLALKNSIQKKNPVRVIRGKKNATSDSSADAENHVYDGLYLVEAFWKETRSRGKAVFKFKLRRIPGQPKLSWNMVKKSNMSKILDGLCNVDISEGKENYPICAVNELDNEKPPPFIYMVKMIYQDWCMPLAPKSCGCRKRCSESEDCACVAKNEGDSPYNHDGAIVFPKKMVYECGPHCTCPPSCYMRVAQHGIKFQLEIFKTETRGWGVRSLNSIPSGSFICEYTGEVIEDKDAERLTGKDEYLFDIGEKDGFTINAARKGNIGRFINHSCSPNLYSQDVFYDHDDTRIPHVMFFAEKNIPPLEELSYDYNYEIDKVADSNGNIKKKNCYCGSNECTGRLY